ncbi:hypothetical protein BX600DRAFT_443051 [Xylariales sp. PMI_506]|nr:hypothetical protein BX600DRAFT_443051 [Xylariales sp. PMI_506]
MSTYKPTEHNGLREDGQPDQRVNTGEFAHGKVDPHKAGKQGGRAGAGSSYDDNNMNDNNNNRRGSGGNNNNNNRRGSGGNNNNNNNNNQNRNNKGEFAHGKVDPAEAGRKGGNKSGRSDDY